MYHNILPRGGSVWDGHTPENEEDEGPWDWQRATERYAQLVHRPGVLRLDEAREIVRLGRFIAQGGGK